MRSDPEFVDWLAVDRSDAREFDVAIHRRWLDPTQPLAKTVLAPAHGALVTSATLTGGGDWEGAEARALRHDIDRLSRRFGVSFEQACHRLSTLQRPGAEGVPFYFCRVDMAGNITKRHSATRLQFARFGGACPLWHVHEAAANPDRIMVQHAETPDGVRYVSMAKGLVKGSGRFDRMARRYAVVLGCEATHAAEFVYADAIDRTGVPDPIGISCRLCPRAACDQRAFPPSDRAIAVEPDVRRVVPYRVV